MSTFEKGDMYHAIDPMRYGPIFVAAFLLVCVFGLTISRVLFHPLRHVPGPFVAAATGAYEFYYDVVVGSAYLAKILRLHEQYGPIVRIAPNHVHINDPQVFKRIYGPKEDFTKSPHFYDNVGVPGSLMAITNPKEHRPRRNVMNPAFTPQAATRQEPHVADCIQKYMSAIRARGINGTPLDIQILFRKLTLDTISRTLFGGELGLLEAPEEYPVLVTNVETFLRTMWLLKHIPIIAKIALRLPLAVAEVIAPGYAIFMKQCRRWIADIETRRAERVLTDDDDQKTVFDLILDDDMPDQDKVMKAQAIPAAKVQQLVDDAFVAVIAGSESTTIALAYSTYHLLRNPQMLQQLKDELRNVPRSHGGKFVYSDLASLQYLTAVVRESLRIATPVPGPLPRLVPKGGYQFGSFFLPAGTIISVAEWTVHNNEQLFPNPEVFEPARWIGDKSQGMEQWLVPFSKGPRQCIGKNLAYMQLYLCLAETFTQFDMELFETDEESMKWIDTGFLTNKSHVKVRAWPSDET